MSHDCDLPSDGSKRRGEVFEGGGLDRCAVESKQLSLVMDRGDGIDKPLGGEAKAKSKVFDDQFLATFLAAFLATFLATFLA